MSENESFIALPPITYTHKRSPRWFCHVNLYKGSRLLTPSALIFLVILFISLFDVAFLDLLCATIYIYI